MERSYEQPLTDAENEAFLRWLCDQKLSMGIQEHEVEVQFDNVHITAELHVGRRALPTLTNAVANAFQETVRSVLMCPTKKKSMKILKGVSGIIKPSRMTLILGSPGSGKSTLLRALSGRLDPTLNFRGRVTHNSQDLNPYVSQRCCAYVTQQDLHHAEMTVRETLDFSRRMLHTSYALDISMEAKKSKGIFDEFEPTLQNLFKGMRCEGRQLETEYIIKMLGLDECADTRVGDEMRRGISGGEKKRLTIGEMLVGLEQSFFMDDISTGLDSSTTFQIIKFLRQMTHLMNLTMVISLLQPPPETFELFDDLILLCEGHIVYQGPRDSVLDFFEHMHFKCPERKNIADFLQEITSEVDQAQFWSGEKGEYQYLSVEELAESFYCFHLGQLLLQKLCEPCNRTAIHLPIQASKQSSISKWKTFKACLSRELLLARRNFPVHVFKTLQIALLAFVIMTLFFRREMKHNSIADGNKFFGAITAGVVIVKFNGMTELSMMIRRLPVFYKQRELLLLPGWAVISSILILSLPMSLFETGIWTFMTYFVIGFAPSAYRFSLQFLAYFSIHQMSMGLFRFVAVVGRTQVMANMLGIATLIAVYIFGGFIVSKDNIRPWLIWGYWASPMTYSQNAVALNEFLDTRWSTQIDYGNFDAGTVGETILITRGILTKWKWYWISIGVLLSFSLVFNALSILALTYFNSPCKIQNNIKTMAMPMKNKRNHELEATRNTISKRGRVLPFKRLTLAFCHISYYVDMPTELMKKGRDRKKLQLLNDVSGAFRSGVLTALMGVTGAGKTTLLDVLAGRKTGGYVEGTITISGYPKKQETFARISGYCEQTDIHSPFLTVYESLKYSAWLRLPSTITTHDREKIVEEIMELVELKQLRNAMVGLPGLQGLSAGQRKRLTIAVELVANPSIIFMDEPTSTLDARAAAIVMRTVRKTVDTGRAIVCTIHQPSIEIFEAFDELLLMKRGQLIYAGPLGSLSLNMIQYFEAIPGVPKIKDEQNPAAWMLHVSSSAMEYQLGIDYAETYQKSLLYRDNMELVGKLMTAEPAMEDLHFPSTYSQSFTEQFIACLWKQHNSYWKNPEHNVVRFIITLITSLLFGIVFWQIGSKITSEEDIFNILGVMYGSALFLGFTNANILQPVVWMERKVFYRESLAGMYSPMPFAISQITAEIPYFTIQVLIFSTTVYPMIGFQFTFLKFAWFTMFILLSFIYFTLFGMMVVALTPVQEIAAGLSFLIFVLWNIFSGYIIPWKMIPIWWRWYYWANPASWTMYGLMLTQLGDREESINVPGSLNQTIREFLEDYLGLEDKYLTLIIILHLCIIILFTFVYCLSIKYLNFQRR